ncbi:MAG: HD-GYP domain-containing protein [Veillonellales bacterium]
MVSAKELRCVITKVSPNMMLARDLLDDGTLLLRAGTILTVNLIRLLQQWGVCVLDVVADKQGSPKAAADSVNGLSVKYQDTVNQVRQAFDSISHFKEIPLRKMRELANQSIEPLVHSGSILSQLHVMRRIDDDYTFNHSVNVAIIAGILAKWEGYKEKDLKDIILAGLLHDVGKTQIPLNILNKPGKLSADEMEIMRLHSTFGYHFIRQTNGVPKAVALSILQHHERLDGSGYPQGLKADEIHYAARIVAISDVYDALTSDRVYRRGLTPFAAVEMLIDEMGHQLDAPVCSTFLLNVRDYLIGNVVMLSDGREATVVLSGRFMADRPLVRTVDGEFIDLEQNKELTIIKILQA